MRETYQRCRKCGYLTPLPSYFYEKKELPNDWKTLCVWCIEKILRKIKKQNGFAETKRKTLL